MNDQTLRSLDDQALMDVVGGGGGCDQPLRQPCEPSRSRSSSTSASRLPVTGVTTA